MIPAKKRNHRAEDDLLDWFTISYRTIYVVVAGVLAISGAIAYHFYFRETPQAPIEEVAPATVTSARFTTLEGSVKVKPVGTFEWVNADRNMVLKKSDLVRTGPGAAAEITFFDGTVVHVRPDSLITIEETSEDPSTKARKVAWHISSGEVNFQTVRKNVPGSETEVSTPTARGTVGELSSAAVRVAETGDSDFRLFAGSGRVETRTGQKYELASSEAVNIDASGKAGPKVALPAMPVLLAPPHQAEITYPNPNVATTLLAWKPVAGASGYHVMVDYSAYFNRPIVDRKGLRDSSVELRGLDVGKYYWRVAALDEKGEEGNFSAFARFTVSSAASGPRGDGPPPPLVIESVDTRQNILQVKGRTEPGATVTVNGQRVEVDGDGSFNDYITLEKAGRQLVVIRATGLNGGVNERKQPVVVSY
jgi:FecR protein/Glucodextranase, domain B